MMLPHNTTNRRSKYWDKVLAIESRTVKKRLGGNAEIVVVKNVPLVQTKYRKMKYPFASMEHGDSFSVLPTPEKPLNYIKKILKVCAKNHIKSNPEKEFHVEELENEVKVWRTK